MGGADDPHDADERGQTRDEVEVVEDGAQFKELPPDRASGGPALGLGMHRFQGLAAVGSYRIRPPSSTGARRESFVVTLIIDEAGTVVSPCL
jgi:hypothetical protein